MGLGNMINTLDPEAVVIGGGVSNINFYTELRKRVKKYAYPVMFKGTKIVKNKLGDSSGVLGAASLVL
jgi:fructokinase